MHSQLIKDIFFIVSPLFFEPAKVQVKPKTPRQKQARKTLPAKEEESTQDSELPGPSVQTKISNSLDVEKNTLTCGKDLDDCSTGDQTTQTRTITSQNRWGKKEINQINFPKCVVDTHHMIHVNFYFPILTENPKTTLALQANLRLAKPLPKGLRSKLHAQREKDLN